MRLHAGDVCWDPHQHCSLLPVERALRCGTVGHLLSTSQHLPNGPVRGFLVRIEGWVTAFSGRGIDGPKRSSPWGPPDFFVTAISSDQHTAILGLYKKGVSATMGLRQKSFSTLRLTWTCLTNQYVLYLQLAGSGSGRGTWGAHV